MKSRFRAGNDRKKSKNKGKSVSFPVWGRRLLALNASGGEDACGGVEQDCEREQ